MTLNILPEVEALTEEIIANRRDFHQYPELGFEENRSAKIIAEKLQSYGIAVKTGVGKTGVIGDLIGGGDGKIIALRADMDALPIQETNNVPYKSKNEGVMHACGHDGHMAMLLGTAKILAAKHDYLSGNIRFIFQPAEEGAGGARYMIADGCLDGVDEIYGIHLWNYQRYGEIGVKSGPTLAAADIFTIKVMGKGGHGAAPQGTSDAVVAAAELVMSLQKIVSRNTNPLESTVITVGKISGGHNFNVIADEVSLYGTARALTEENRKMIQERMQEVIDGVSKSTGTIIELDYQKGYPPTVNSELEVQKVITAAHKIVGDKTVEPYLTMGGEDFSFYLERIPGCFFFVGAAPEYKELMSVPHHCSHFDIDERALLVGTSMFVQLINDQLFK